MCLQCYVDGKVSEVMLVQYFKQNFISENVNPDFKVLRLLLL